MCALDNEMGESGFCEEAVDIVDILKKSFSKHLALLLIILKKSFSIAQAGG